MGRAQEVARQMVEELSYKVGERQFRPVQQVDNVFVFAVEDIIFELHFF